VSLQASDQRLKKTVSLIENFEGFSEKAYWDIDAYSIGYGTHLTTPSLITSYRFATISKTEAQELMIEKVMDIHNVLLCIVKVPLTDNQYSVLVSFTYNVGIPGLMHSKLVECLNARQYKLASNQLRRWVHTKHRVNKSLIKRRKNERLLFLKK
jgi:lysozyme